MFVVWADMYSSCSWLQSGAL